ncbi:hypothetical protein [Gemmatimonas sp.]|uniref:hypothetical protein n=1 Tax=Gemmatimonas sp. TaxID=1962908 RepID=UPI003DA525C4
MSALREGRRRSSVLHAVRQKEENPGYLSSCLSCSTGGRRWGVQVPGAMHVPVRATNVADVHVLAQDIIQHAERKRLLVFCDNRQDAAFQAGWMKDHARRFRLRALMAEALTAGHASVGDVALYLDDRLERDATLSRALAPEVWEVVRREGSGGRHEQERRKFLRIQVLREVTLSSKQSLGLEPWGRMKVEYEGLDASWPWIQERSKQLGIPADTLRDGVAVLLDSLRRKRLLFDPERGIFSRYWMEGDQEIQAGYLPVMGAPQGTKLRRDSGDDTKYVVQWLSDKGDTAVRLIARSWGVLPSDIEMFLESLFKALVDKGLLRPVTLKGSKDRALPGVTGVYQVDADALRMVKSHGVWRCKSCRRRTTRATPKSRCPGWRCDGTLEFVPEDPDNYDLQLLDQGYTLLRPEEHTAMVPHDERERTGESLQGRLRVRQYVHLARRRSSLGVDIGQLDSILNAQRTAAAGELLAAGRSRRATASHGGQPHVLPLRVTRPRVLQRSVEVALWPRRSAGVQSAKSLDDREACACGGHHAVAPVRAGPRSPGGRAAADRPSARREPAEAGWCLSV